MLEHLEQAGYAVVPDVISGTTCDRLINAMETALRANGGDHAMRNVAQKVPAIAQLAESDPILALARSILGENTFMVRSLFFDKTTDANWKVAWHQDLTIAVQEKIEIPGFGPWSKKDGILHVQPPAPVLERMVTLWVHLDECDLSNGPLQILPGTHCTGKLTAEQIFDWRQRVQPWPCLVPRGAAVLMRPLVLHASFPAVRPAHRRVVHLEFAAENLPGGLQWVR